MMKDVLTPAAPAEVRSVIKKCLENAALVNYTKVSEVVKIEGKRGREEQETGGRTDATTRAEVVDDGDMTPAAKLAELVKLAELCVDLLQENNDYYAEVSTVESISLVQTGLLPSLAARVSLARSSSLLAMQA